MARKKHDAKHKDPVDMNRDPLTGTPGAHPIGTGAGAAGGAATGAAIGTAVGGPVGFAVGGVAGALVGGLAGKGVAEAIHPTAEDSYWRAHYLSRPYVSTGTGYEALEPAYRYGWESHVRYEGKKWPAVESDMRAGWEKARGDSKMEWEEARHAARDAWERLDEENARMDDDGDVTGLRPSRVVERRVNDRTRTSSKDRAGSSTIQTSRR